MTTEVALSAPEKVTLVDCEAVIERGIRQFVDVGTALARVRDGRLYREAHGTFEAYCRERWGFTPQHAGRLMIAAEVVTQMEPIGSTPTNEAQARELGEVPPELRAEIWRETVERTDGRPTAAAVREVRNERIPIQPDIAQPVDDWPSIPPPGSAVKPAPQATPPAAEPAPKPKPPPWSDELQRQSELRAAATGLRSALTYLTSTVLKPPDLAAEYADVIDQFPQPDLDYAAETMRAIADIRNQGASDG